MATLSLVYVLEETATFFRVDAALVDAGDTALVELVVDDGVGMGLALDLPSQDLILWEFAVGEVGDERLRPGRHLPDGEDALLRR